MASLADGTYYIHSASSPYRCLDVQGNGAKNGTNILVHTLNRTDAQVWEVSTRNDGSRQIVNRYSGKSIAVKNTAITTVGANIQLYDDNDGLSQKWRIVDASSTVTYDNTSYDTFYIKTLTTTLAKAASSSEDANVQIAAEGTAALCRWFFVPVEKLKSGGIYEIRAYLNTSMALEIANSSTTNGANLRINSAAHTRNQQFTIEQESGGKWSIRCLASNKYIDVDSAIAEDGTNVQQWDDNETRAQRWNMVSYGTKTVGGVECGVFRIGSYVTSDGLTYMLDLSAANTKATTNVQIWSNNGTDAQLFVLYPTSATDTTMPVPYDLALASSLGGPSTGYKSHEQNVASYLMWKCSKSWAADGTNHYEYRYRTRSMNPSSSSWDSWSSWTAWRTAPVKTDGKAVNQIWLSKYVLGTYAWSAAKNKQIEYQVRSAGTDGYSSLHSECEEETFGIWRAPDNDFTSIAMTPDGLMFAIESDYGYGTTILTPTALVDTNGYDIIDGKLDRFEVAEAGSGLIPLANLKRLPVEGEFLRLMYTNGYDQYPVLPGADEESEIFEVSYDGGTESVEPTLTLDGLTLTAVVPNLGTVSVMVLADGKLYECPKRDDVLSPQDTGYAAFDVPYIFDGDCEIITFSKDSTGENWGCDSTDYSANGTVAYGWHWEGGRAYLHKFLGGIPSTSIQTSPVYEENQLDSREFSTVSFAPGKKRTITVNGALWTDEDDYSSIDDFLALEGQHAIFQDTHGTLHNVAVVGVNYERYEKWDLVSVSMIEEAR